MRIINKARQFAIQNVELEEDSGLFDVEDMLALFFGYLFGRDTGKLLVGDLQEATKDDLIAVLQLDNF